MKILITNDDGALSPALAILKEHLKEHEIYIVAPEKDRSGCSHAISLNKPVKFKQLSENFFSCSGTPADCVLYSMLGAIPFKPDFIISGINLGANLGTDLIYSGTVAAARQAVLMGIPAIAVSLNKFNPPYPLDYIAKFLADNVERFYEKSSKDYFLNINFPESISENTKIEYVNLGRRFYHDTLAKHALCKKEKFYFLTGTLDHLTMEEDSDWAAVERGNIAVSKVYVHPSDNQKFKDNNNLNLTIPTKQVD